MKHSPITGKCSVFGGPQDNGVGPHEGLALVEPYDLLSPYWRELFLPQNPEGTTGLARRLNPKTFYCAMRWSQLGISREEARTGLVLVNALHPRAALAPFQPTGSAYFRPVDFGPGDGSVVDGQNTKDTGRIIDLSPGGALALGLQTDDEVTVEFFLQGEL